MKKLRQGLCKYGNIEILKEDYVLSLLLTGKGLTKADNYTGILGLMIDYAGDKFPLIECMRNEDNYLCLILKPKT